jgi:integrase/recombinase XerD
LRIGEARALSYGSVREAEEKGWKVLRVVGKGQKEREVHVSPPVWKAYIEYHERRREPWVDSTPLFAAIPKGKPIKAVAIDKRMSLSSIFARFKRIAAKAGLPHEISPHALRHFFATESDSSGASVEAIRIALGHSDLGVTTRYLARVRRGINPAFEKISLPQVVGLFG